VPVNLRTDGRPGDAQRSQQCHLQASLASTLGGTVLTAQTIMLAGYAYPSLAAHRTQFAICAAAALAGAVTALPVSGDGAGPTGGLTWGHFTLHITRHTGHHNDV
jgi:hypothetical protein